MKITRGFGNLTALTNQINDRTKLIYDTARDTLLSIRNIERWYGKRDDQTGNEWAEEHGLTPYETKSNLEDWGTTAGKEAKIWGTDDVFPIAGNTHFGVIRILVVDNSQDVDCYLRFIWGTGTISDAITAGQWSSTDVQNVTSGSKSGGNPTLIMMPLIDLSVDKLWVQSKSSIFDHTIKFKVGIHALPEHML